MAVAEIDHGGVGQRMALNPRARQHGGMKTQPWTPDKIAAQQRQDRLAVRWSIATTPTGDASSVPARMAREARPSWLRQPLDRVNRIAVLVTPGAVAIAASLFG